MIVASSLPASLWGEEKQSFTVDGITYTVIDQEVKTVELTRGARTNPSDNTTINVVVPEQVTAPNGETYKVISLGDNSYSNTSIESIVFPETIVSIGASAFYSCDRLTEITIPGSVESIGSHALYGCDNIKTLIVEESRNSLISSFDAFSMSSLETLKVYRNIETEGNFYDTSNLRSVELGGSITKIWPAAFFYASNLTSVVIPETVTEIGPRAFYGAGIMSIVLPKNLRSIDDEAFLECSNLSEISIPGSVEQLGPRTFGGCPNLSKVVFESSETPLYMYGVHKEGSSRNGSFSETPVEQLSIFRNLAYTIAGQNICVSPKNLRKVALGGLIIEIGQNAFNGASLLEEIVIPETVTAIGQSAFKDTGIKSIVIPKSITSVSDYSFSGCANLSQVILPETLQTIGKQAFGNCTGLREIIIPGSVESIGYGAFYGCGNLRSLVIEESNNPLSLSYGYEMSDAAFGSAPIETLKVYRDIEVKPEFANASVYDTSNLRSVELGGSITKIWPWAFSGASKLTTITIPESVKEIGWSAFDGCANLSQVLFPENLQTIGYIAFGNCTGLTEIIIPGSVESIDAAAFNGCDNLRSLVIEESSNPLNVCGGTFGNDPIEMLKVYRDINSDQNFYDASYLRSVELGGSITKIWSNAFANALQLNTVVIPESVTEIGWEAFSNSGITSIELPETISLIGGGAFGFCRELKNIRIPSGITSLSDGIFTACSKLTNVILPDKLLSIGENAFNGCGSLSEIDIPDSVTYIDDYAFNSCSLKKIALPSALKTIGRGAFCDNNKLVSVEFNDGLEFISHFAFERNSSLKTIKLPASVMQIECAFDGCYLDTVTCAGATPASISPGTFIDYVYVSAQLNVPVDAESAYKSAEGWRLFKNINERDDLTPGPDEPLSLNVNLSVAGELMSYIERGKVKSVVSLKITGEINGTDLSVINLLSNLEKLDLSGATIVAGGEPYYEHGGKTWRTSNGVLDRYWLHSVSPSEIKLPQVTSIRAMACADMPFTTLELPVTLVTIGDYAFSDCGNLTSVEMGDSVRTVGAGAFSGCQSLNKVSIGYSVNKIGDKAFAGTSVRDIWSWNPIPPAISGDAFDEDAYYIANLHVYEPARARYWLNPVWGEFGNVTGESVPTPISSITLDAASVTMDVKSKRHILAEINPSYATIPMVEWVSSDESVASVSENGVVTAHSEGETVITARAVDGSDVEASCIVTVVSPSGIETINVDEIGRDAVIYDLSGRKINVIRSSGVYILNGNKVYLRK